MNDYFISFVDDIKGGNIGCIIVQAEDELSALEKTHTLKQNPGGQSAIMLLSDNSEDIQLMGYNKLHSKKDMANLGYCTIAESAGDNAEKLGEELAEFRNKAVQVCSSCNDGTHEH